LVWPDSAHQIAKPAGVDRAGPASDRVCPCL